VRAALDALGFLTRIPVPPDPRPFTAGRLNRAALFFPLVGVLVGALLGGVRALAELAGVPPGPATVLGLTAAVLVTGAFHEDGLADAADGLGAHVGRERKLEILKDSRVGTYGALAVALPLLLAWTALAPLGVGECLGAAVAGHVLGRWSTLPHSLLFAPARTGSSATLVRASPAVTLAATAYSAAIVVVALGPGPGLAALAVAAALTLGLAAAFARALGGATGDTFGAVNKLVEVAVYVTAAATL
jgi:adenosylcobinamide-GDP ribazoletransferase